MRKSVGVLCILLGVCCLIASLGFVVYNNIEEKKAKSASVLMVQSIHEKVNENIDKNIVEEISYEMKTEEVDGYECIGILAIPALEVELPVLTDWNYTKLKVAPCHYYGTYYEPNFVIAAHNYQAHFGRLSQLQQKDMITFTDVSGNVYCYEVMLIETLQSTATLEMITSGFDLSLYTCTPGGGSRVTVRCNLVEE